MMLTMMKTTTTTRDGRLLNQNIKKQHVDQDEYEGVGEGGGEGPLSWRWGDVLENAQQVYGTEADAVVRVCLELHDLGLYAQLIVGVRGEQAASAALDSFSRAEAEDVAEGLERVCNDQYFART
jgi:hypothetical protein